MALLSRAGNRISFRLICSCTKVRSKESTHLIARFSIPALYSNRLWRNLLTFAHKQKAMDSPDARARRNLTLPELTHSHALKPWNSAVTRRLRASTGVLPSWVFTVRSRTRDCAQPLLSETFKVDRPLSATNSFETFTRWKTSRRNQCFTSQRTLHKRFEKFRTNCKPIHPTAKAVGFLGFFL